MTNLFFLLTVFFIQHEVKTLFNTKRVSEFIINLNNKGKDIKPTVKESVFMLFNLVYFVWTFAGLLTDQWWIFLIIILLGFISKSKISILHIKLDAFITLVLLLFLVLNHYYLHYVPF